MGTDDDDAAAIHGGKLSRALKYKVTGIPLWVLLAAPLVAFLIGAWAF